MLSSNIPSRGPQHLPAATKRDQLTQASAATEYSINGVKISSVLFSFHGKV